MIGEILSNRYEILAKVGDGGMALVYSAKDTLLNRLVAVKVLRDQFVDDREFIDRFHREAQAAASLSHPNVVNVYDVGQIDKTPFIVMEYVEGKNLSEIIREQGTLDPKYSVEIALQICSALAHAHKHQIVHRDIKPHNILITKDDQVKVTDFGIAAVASMSVTQTGMVLGSVSYFSPEQARGNKVDFQSDLYSLGILLYEMLCGRVPFRGDTPISIALKHIQDKPIPPSELNSKISPNLEIIILKLLAKRPNERFESARVLSSEFEKLDFHSTIDKTQKLPVVDLNLENNEESPDDLLVEQEEEIESVSTKAKMKRKRKLPIFFLILLLLAGLTIGVFTIVPRLLFAEDVQVPDIVGLSTDEAEAKLNSVGLLLATDIEVFDNELPAGHIISQDPRPERMKKSGQYVLVRVSKGPEVVIMPSLIGQTSREAQLELTQIGFILGSVITEHTTEYPANTVIEQDPKPGGEVFLGVSVDLTVSRGLDTISTLILPDLRGDKLNDAMQLLDDLGLNVGNTIGEYSTTVPENYIIEQNPPAGAEVEVDWSVDLVYSQGLPGGSQAPTEPEQPQRWTTDGMWRTNEVRIEIPEGRSQEVVIIVADDFGAREIYRETHNGGSNFSYTVQGRGDQARIQVYIGGRLFTDQYFVD